jgi:hypothetical protein
MLSAERGEFMVQTVGGYTSSGVMGQTYFSEPNVGKQPFGTL